jgi:glycosyltransferase involved in cell wall biosynthesis
VKANFVSDPGQRTGSGDGFLYVGRLAPEKGIGTIVDAASRLEPGIEIRIAGDGPEAAAVNAAAASHRALRPLGRLDRAAVAAELAQARALVFPSLWYEGMPMTILEAFAAGVPVIAARLGAAATMVHDGETGLTFEPGDAAGLADRLAWAQAHPDEMAAFGRAAREAYVATYTPEASHARLLEIYAVGMARAAAREAAA